MDFNFGDMFKNLGNIKANMEAAQERLKGMKITGESGAGLVRITLDGSSQVVSIDISPDLLVKDEKEVLEELIISAFQNAQTKVKESQQHEMSQFTGNLNIPGLDKLLGL